MKSAPLASDVMLMLLLRFFAGSGVIVFRLINLPVLQGGGPDGQVRSATSKTVSIEAREARLWIGTAKCWR